MHELHIRLEFLRQGGTTRVQLKLKTYFNWHILFYLLLLCLQQLFVMEMMHMHTYIL